MSFTPTPNVLSAREKLILVAGVANVPDKIINYLIDELGCLEQLEDLVNMDPDDVPDYRKSFIDDMKEEGGLWKPVVSIRLVTLIKWFKSYKEEIGGIPNPINFTYEMYMTSPKLLRDKEDDDDPIERRRTQGGRFSNITSRSRRSSIFSTKTQFPNRSNVKVSINDYPTFSGKHKDWVTFNRTFRAVASAHGYDYILQDDLFQVSDLDEEDRYKEDNTFIFNAFKKSWALGINYYIVEQNEKNLDGRKVYLDAKDYYRGEAMKDAILNESMQSLCNAKLTSTTHGGVETFNNAFNNAVIDLNHQGHNLNDKILKSIYIASIQDPIYEAIIDQAAGDSKITLRELQVQIHRKYIQSSTKRRSGAIPLKEPRFVNLTQLGKETSQLSEPEDEFVFDQHQHRDVLATMQYSKDNTFPLIPKHLYDSLDDAVKETLNKQRAWYRSKIPQKYKPTPSPTKSGPNAPRGILKTTTTDDADNEDIGEEVNQDYDTNQVVDQQEDLVKNFTQFINRGRHMNVTKSTKVYNISSRTLHASFHSGRSSGRLISDNAADTGSLSPKHCHIVYQSQEQVMVNGCHPTIVKPYYLASGITAIDLPSGTILVGQHEVPIIPNSEHMLVSETQARCNGMDIDSRSKRFGGRGSIIFADDTEIPLRLENALMTCPIRMPTEIEIKELEVHWLTADQSWDPNNINEHHDSNVEVPLGNNLGTFKLDNITPDSIDFWGDTTSTTYMSDFQIDEAAAWINFNRHKHTKSKECNIHFKHTKFKTPDFEKYRRFFGWKPIEIIKKTFEATTQWAATSFQPPLNVISSPVFLV